MLNPEHRIPQTSRGTQTAHLKTILLSSLLDGDEISTTDLVEAGVQDGFFYIDLRNSEAQCLLDILEELFQLNAALFSLPEDELIKFDLDIIGPSKIDGYKPSGRNTGVVSGKQDGFQIYLVRSNYI